jgi:hypothetical protein
MKKKVKMKKEQKQAAILIGVLLLAIIFIPSNITGNAVQGQPLRYVPLSEQEIEKAVSTILSTEFIKDVPEKNPIALMFYSFEGNEKVIRDGFLIGNNQLLTEGVPSLYILVHAKYIDSFDGTNLCEIIQMANSNGDIGTESEYGNAKLLLKYSSLLKYRDCFGF